MALTLTCKGCGLSKPPEAYHVDPHLATGRRSRCRVCCQARRTELRRLNPEKYLARDAYWRANERSDPRKRALYYSQRKEHQKRTPKQNYAQWCVKSAIRSGKMTRGACEVCGSVNAQGHHDDYDKPLEVRWLCPLHHRQHHVDNGPGKNSH